MRILHISMNAYYTEGYGYQDNLLPKYQVKLGNEVYLITSVLCHGKNGIEEVEESEYINEYGVHVYRRKAKGMLGKISGIFGYYNLRKDIEAINPDLIMIHGLCNMLVKQAAGYKHEKNPDCHIIMDNHQDGNTTKLKNPLLRLARKVHRHYIKRYIQDVDKVYGVTSWRVDYAKNEYGVPEEKLDLLLMGYDTDSLDFGLRDEIRESIRQKHGIKKDDFVILTGGKLAKNKNILEEMRAFERIKNDSLCFLIFGPVYDDVKVEFDEIADRDKRIKYIGPVPSDKIYDYCMASDLGVFAGRHSVIWEQAVGVGLPCIFKSYGENTHLDVGGNCILLQKCDEDDIYNNILLCINDKAKYNELKKAAEDNGRRCFSYYEIAKKSLECVRKEEA